MLEGFIDSLRQLLFNYEFLHHHDALEFSFLKGSIAKLQYSLHMASFYPGGPQVAA